MVKPYRLKFIVAALGLLSGLTRGLQGVLQLEPHVSRSQPNLLSLLTECLRHPHAEVRQSGYALVGYMAMNRFPLLRQYIPRVMNELIMQLDPEPKVEFIGTCINASWAVGEIALRCGRGECHLVVAVTRGTRSRRSFSRAPTDDSDFQLWVHPLISRLIPILLHPKAPGSIRKYAAVSIGRIGLMHPMLVALLLSDFAQAWCQALCAAPECEEKDSAFRGLCTLVQTNPVGITKVRSIHAMLSTPYVQL